MPLYVADYLADTAHLRAAQSGAYLHLIMHYWLKGALPDDDAALARIAGMTAREWLFSKEAILDLFTKPSPWDGKTSADRALGIGRKEQRHPIPISMRSLVAERDGGVCVYCGDKNGPFEFDHKLPWSRGGRHELENLVFSCKSCNRSKGARTIEEWRQ